MLKQITPWSALTEDQKHRLLVSRKNGKTMLKELMPGFVEIDGLLVREQDLPPSEPQQLNE